MCLLASSLDVGVVREKFDIRGGHVLCVRSLLLGSRSSAHHEGLEWENQADIEIHWYSSAPSYSAFKLHQEAANRGNVFLFRLNWLQLNSMARNCWSSTSTHALCAVVAVTGAHTSVHASLIPSLPQALSPSQLHRGVWTLKRGSEAGQHGN